MRDNRNFKVKPAKYIRERGDDKMVQYMTKGPRMMRDTPLAMGPLVKTWERPTSEWRNRPHRGARVLPTV
jgi:hypothetical protein